MRNLVDKTEIRYCAVGITHIEDVYAALGDASGWKHALSALGIKLVASCNQPDATPKQPPDLRQGDRYYAICTQRPYLASYLRSGEQLRKQRTTDTGANSWSWWATVMLGGLLSGARFLSVWAI